MEGTGLRVQALRERLGGRPGLPVPKSPYSLCERKAKWNDGRSGVVEKRRTCALFLFLCNEANVKCCHSGNEVNSVSEIFIVSGII